MASSELLDNLIYDDGVFVVSDDFYIFSSKGYKEEGRLSGFKFRGSNWLECESWLNYAKTDPLYIHEDESFLSALDKMKTGFDIK